MKFSQDCCYMVQVFVIEVKAVDVFKEFEVFSEVNGFSVPKCFTLHYAIYCTHVALAIPLHTVNISNYCIREQLECCWCVQTI